MAKLFNAGDQVPVTEFVDVVGKVAKTAPEQIGLTELNVGTIRGVTVTITVFDRLHATLVVNEISSIEKSFPPEAVTLSYRAI